MSIDDLDLGDTVYAAHPIIDGGSSSMPYGEEGTALAQAGARGVNVMKGHVEEGRISIWDAQLAVGLRV